MTFELSATLFMQTEFGVSCSSDGLSGWAL
jgi:hypothetical protein